VGALTVADKQLTMAYTVCKGIARSRAKNFYYAFLALPREKRNALCAVYAFMRHADDLSDEPGMTPEQRRHKLQEWSEALHKAVAGERSDDPVIMAVSDSQQRFKIPVELFDQLVYGTSLDVDPRQDAAPGPQLLCQDFQELYDYCYYVASVVGLVCIKIFGYQDPAAEALAVKTGIAFQLTNIIRDVKEDAALGRVYIPAEDLQRFEVPVAELASNTFGEGAFWLLQHQAQRARQYYKAAEELIPLIDDDSRPALWALVEIYRRLLDKITAKHYNVFDNRVALTVPEKLSVLSQGLLQVVF
jgi:phytoene synthase